MEGACSCSIYKGDQGGSDIVRGHDINARPSVTGKNGRRGQRSQQWVRAAEVQGFAGGAPSKCVAWPINSDSAANPRVSQPSLRLEHAALPRVVEALAALQVKFGEQSSASAADEGRGQVVQAELRIAFEQIDPVLYR